MKVEFIYLADKQDNRITLKFRHFFTFDHQDYIAASPMSREGEYVLLKSVENTNGLAELQDISDNDEFEQADNYYRRIILK